MEKLAEKKWTYVPASARPYGMKMVKYHFFENDHSKNNEGDDDDVDDDDNGAVDVDGDGGERPFHWRDRHTVFHDVPRSNDDVPRSNDDVPRSNDDGVYADRHWKNHVHRRTKDGFLILFSDLTHLFFCRSSLADLKDRIKGLNPNVIVDSDERLVGLVKHCLMAFCGGGKDLEKTKVKQIGEKRDDAQRLYELRVAVLLNGAIRFQWVFEATQLPPRFLSRQLTLPSLRRRLTFKAEDRRLKALLAAKDAEIEDLKLGGAKVSRKMLETKKFVDDDDVEDADDEPDDEWLRSVEEERESERRSNESTSGGARASSSDSSVCATREPDDERPLTAAFADDAPTAAVLEESTSNAERKRSASPSAASSVPNSFVASSQPPGAKEKAAKLRKKKLGL